MSTINSTLITLKEIVEKQFFFNIPIYQRLYVWENDQIKTLLEDIETAYSKELFYLGGVLVVENETLENGKLYDLIDGQQRFTTLWMIAIVFSNAMQPFIERAEKEKDRHRVTFAIREDIYLFFKKLIAINDKNFEGATPHIINALSLIQSFKERLDTEKPKKSEKIAEFIYHKVKLIFTEVPKQTDLNKLFEIINNRGVQLQHHEILKAQLLNKLSAEDRLKYSYLWDSCSYMEGYIEKNIRDIAKIRIQDLFDNDKSKSGQEDLVNPEKILNAISISQNEFSPLSLLKILGSSKDFDDNSTDKIGDYEADEIRSIITFPMLLQHTLRIFLVKKKESDIPKILDKELLAIFFNSFFEKERTQDDIKEFIKLLWKARYMFDKHIIKWVNTEEGEIHFICKMEKYKNSDGKFYLRRQQPTINKAEALLQSMLYHSQQITTHYWITPYLNYLVNHNGQNRIYLKSLDNHLLCSSETETLVIRTRKFLEDENYNSSSLSTEILKEDLGTSFPHYWFYKLEYVLWKKYKDTKGELWKNFKMTAKNSVEHISPQNPKDTDTNKVDKMLNNFGNISLVSRSINSEYSNLPFNEKRQRFINNNKTKLDSLKMSLIYENETWSDIEAKKHQDEMIKIMNEYLGFS